MRLSYDPEIPLLDTDPEQTIIQNDTGIPMFIDIDVFKIYLIEG